MHAHTDTHTHAHAMWYNITLRYIYTDKPFSSKYIYNTHTYTHTHIYIYIHTQVSPCCGIEFWCRFCHNEYYEAEAQAANRHTLDRWLIGISFLLLLSSLAKKIGQEHTAWNTNGHHRCALDCCHHLSDSPDPWRAHAMYQKPAYCMHTSHCFSLASKTGHTREHCADVRAFDFHFWYMPAPSPPNCVLAAQQINMTRADEIVRSRECANFAA